MEENKLVQKLTLEEVTIKNIPIIDEGIKSFTIYESITQPGILGDIVITDWQAISEFGDIFAGDDIILKFRSENKENLSLKYKIYACENSQVYDHQTYKTIQYMFCSEWLLDGLTRSISKPYKEKYIHEIIEDLLKECGANIGFIETTKQKMENYVTPLWTAVHSISHLTSFAKNQQDIGGYLLWTDMKTDKVNCSTIDYMMKKSLGYYKEFTFHPSNIFYEGKMHHITVESNFDIIRHINQGMNKIQNYGFWFDKKKFIKTEDTIKDYKHAHISKKFPINPKYLEEKYWSNKFVSLYPKQAESVKDEKDIIDLIEGRQYYEYTMLFSDIMKINILTQGESTRRAGQIAYCDFPSQNEKTSNTGHTNLTGDYLIRDIKHVYQDGLYSQVICLASDGYKQFKGDIVGW